MSSQEQAEKEFVTFAEASVISGIDKYRIGTVVKRAGVTVYKSPQDARKRYLRREDVARLTGYQQVE